MKGSAKSMGRFGLLVFVFICVVYLLAPRIIVHAQSETLTCGQTVTGEITDEKWDDIWTFEGLDDQTVEFAMTFIEELDRNLQPRIVLTTPAGRILSEDNWSGSGSPRARVVYTLPQAYTYLVHATRIGEQDRSTTGRYELHVRCVAPRVQAIQSGGGSIDCGTAAVGQITDEDWLDFWTFDGVEDQTIEVTLSFVEELDRNLQPRVVLATPSGRILSEDNWSGSGTPRARLIFTLPETHQYSIYATRINEQNGPTTGRYELSIRCVVPRAQALQTGGGGISCGVEAIGEITDDNWVDEWTFDGLADQTIEVTMTFSEGLDTYLEPRVVLATPAGRILSDDNWSGSGTPRARLIFTLPETRIYSVQTTRIQENNGRSFGRYELHIRCVVPRVQAVGSGGGDIGCNFSAIGEISDGDWIDIWNLTAGMNEEVTIVMSFTEELDRYLEPRVILTTPAGRILADRNWSGSGAPHASVTFTLPETNTYSIATTRIGEAAGASSGRYALDVSCAGTGEPVEPPVSEDLDATAFDSMTSGVLFEQMVALPIYYGDAPLGPSGEKRSVTIRLTGPLQIQEGVPFDFVIEFLPQEYDVLTSLNRWQIGAARLTLILDDDTSIIAGVPRQEQYLKGDSGPGSWSVLLPPNNAGVGATIYLAWAFQATLNGIVGSIPGVGLLADAAEGAEDIRDLLDSIDQNMTLSDSRLLMLYDYENTLDTYTIPDHLRLQTHSSRTATRYTIPVRYDQLDTVRIVVNGLSIGNRYSGLGGNTLASARLSAPLNIDLDLHDFYTPAGASEP